MLYFIFLTLCVALAGQKCNHKTLSKGNLKSNEYQCQLFELWTFVGNGEYKVFDLLCNETYGSQVYARIEAKSIRVIEECKEFESLCNRTHDSEL